MSVDRLEQLFATYQEDGYAPVPTDLLDWAIAEIEDLKAGLASAESDIERHEHTVDDMVDSRFAETDNALSKYCYELLGTHNPTPLDLRDHPALQRLLDAVR